jgi:hypothetical protein
MGPVEWLELRLQGQEALAVRAGNKLKNEGLLIADFGGVPLRMELDKFLWRERDHVTLKQLWDYFSRYLYLARLRNADVLIGAVKQGVNTLAGDTFAYAQGYDEATGRYLGLATNQIVNPIVDGSSVIVKPEAAQRQLDADEAERTRLAAERSSHITYGDRIDPLGPTNGVGEGAASTPDRTTTIVTHAAPKLCRYHGTVETGSQRLGVFAGTIANEIVQHLALIPGAEVSITIEIQASVPDGVPENVVRTVSENSRTLHFSSSSFEES